MASIEPRNGAFRIVFRFGGRKYSRTLNTCDPSVASSAKTTVEQRIKLIKSGILPPPPDGHDVAGYLISGESTPTKSNGLQKRGDHGDEFGADVVVDDDLADLI